MATIRIDDEVYGWLKNMAQPFEDTPNSVLRRVAGLDNSSVKETKMITTRQTLNTKTDGKKTPQWAFRKPILEVLRKFGGNGARMRVLREVEKLMVNRLSAYDKLDINSGGSTRWQKSAEYEVFVMRKEGLLKSVNETSPGVWALTSKGSEAAG